MSIHRAFEGRKAESRIRKQYFQLGEEGAPLTISDSWDSGGAKDPRAFAQEMRELQDVRDTLSPTLSSSRRIFEAPDGSDLDGRDDVYFALGEDDSSLRISRDSAGRSQIQTQSSSLHSEGIQTVFTSFEGSIKTSRSGTYPDAIERFLSEKILYGSDTRVLTVEQTTIQPTEEVVAGEGMEAYVLTRTLSKPEQARKVEIEAVDDSLIIDGEVVTVDL